MKRERSPEAENTADKVGAILLLLEEMRVELGVSIQQMASTIAKWGDVEWASAALNVAKHPPGAETRAQIVRLFGSRVRRASSAA